MREVRSLGSFENVIEIGIGVQTFHGTADVVGFRVLRLPDGIPKLVIDVAHADACAKATGG